VSTEAASVTLTAARPRPPRGWISKTALIIGELLVTFGVIVFLFIFYELKITDWQTAATQHRLSHQLQIQWQTPVKAPVTVPVGAKPKPVADPPLKVVEGQGFAILRIPRLGAGYHWVVVEGVGHDDLEEGPGHYPGTALPGQLGNMVISGHRTTFGHPFNRLGEVQSGDIVTLQVRTKTYRYRVIGTQIVDPSDTAVIFPVPGKFGATPTRRLLTMTTCNPEYSAAQRMVVTAELVGGQ
jgi:sortase A